MPEILIGDRLSVGSLEKPFVQEGAQQVEVAGLWLVESGQQAVDDAKRRSLPKPEPAPSRHRVQLPILPGRGLERPDDGRPHGDDARGTRDSLDGAGPHRKPLFEEWMFGVDVIV